MDGTHCVTQRQQMHYKSGGKLLSSIEVMFLCVPTQIDIKPVVSLRLALNICRYVWGYGYS